MERYFEKFPITTYNGYNVKNIMLRTKILDRVYKRPDYFKSYELASSVRPDNVAYEVYNDQYLSWLVYHSNKTIDPYYDWYMNEYEFDQYILHKYGDYANAQGRVAYWTNNWYNDSATISISFYNNTLPDSAKKYYEPIFGGKKILEYKRRENDWAVNTNQIWEYTVDSDLTVAIDSKVNISNSSAAQVANGQVLFSNSSLVRIQHVFGEANTDIGTISAGNKTANISAASLVAVNIPQQEAVYWSPISYYDMEDIKNSGKKFLRLLDTQYSMTTALELKRALNP